jgi:hypothetical protein
MKIPAHQLVQKSIILYNNKKYIISESTLYNCKCELLIHTIEGNLTQQQLILDINTEVEVLEYPNDYLLNEAEIHIKSILNVFHSDYYKECILFDEKVNIHGPNIQNKLLDLVDSYIDKTNNIINDEYKLDVKITNKSTRIYNGRCRYEAKHHDHVVLIFTGPHELMWHLQK